MHIVGKQYSIPDLLHVQRIRYPAKQPANYLYHVNPRQIFFEKNSNTSRTIVIPSSDNTPSATAS